MTRRNVVALAALVAAMLSPAAGAAQDRPSEDELFGGPPEEREVPSPPASAGREGQAPPAAQAAPPPPQRLVGRADDVLAIGGQLYLRGQTTFLEGAEPGDAALSSPNLLDVYLDARPNDRVRAFVLGRMSFDPTLPADEPPLAAAPDVTGSLLEDAAFARRGTSEPRGALDQLWVNFDLERRVFVTAGRQHVKWGVGRFWNPTDYLHPVRRDPLAVFDVRTGTTMVKLHAPWEARGWNAYAVAVLEDLAGELRDTSRLGRVGVGGRAEVVLGPMELGLDALAQDGHRPRFGVDVSAGVWELDVYAEAAIRTSVDTPRWREVPGTTSDTPILERFERRDRLGPTAQVVAGGSWSARYSDEDAVTVGAEYFYDQSGYDHPRIYPVLLGVAGLAAVGGAGNPFAAEPNPFTPFYLGRHYGGAFVALPAPGPWNDTSLTLSVLGNLSDKSFVARLDHSVLALTYLRVETFVAGHFGTPEGEFRLGFDIPPQPIVSGQPPVAIRTDPMVLDVGVALRVSL